MPGTSRQGAVTPEVNSTSLDRLPVTVLRGVGPRSAQRLADMGMETVQDVLFHLPRRYEDRTRIIPVGALRAGDHAVVEARVDLAEVRYGRRRSLLVRVSDGSGALTLRFFHFSNSQQKGFLHGVRLRLYGEVRRGPATLEMVHPEYRLLSAAGEESLQDCLTPVYPAAEGVQQPTLRKLTEQSLQLMDDSNLPDYLPAELIEQLRLWPLHESIRYVHRPPPDADIEQLQAGAHPSQQRLVIEEMLAHHLSLRRIRERGRRQDAYPLTAATDRLTAFRHGLGFELTQAQKRVIGQILEDLQRDHPMMRLVQGDVGSGKTVVAAVAALQAINSGAQVALMAPTELLAEQHYRNFSDWMSDAQISIDWLSGKVKGRERTEVLSRLSDGSTRLVIGTHALFQDGVEFDSLGLVVIDEQHRFGVHQRLALRDKGIDRHRVPHQLIMTATPIPRTLAMAIYADLDTSVIDELPPGRTPVQTVVIPDQRRDEVVERVRRACADGRQAYWVCTLIEESETLQCQTAEDACRQLAQALPSLRVGMVHGRMRDRDKLKYMMAFKRGEIDLLVATTVIEVGVDVPNASLMIIENAERLGLSQLHQLRGRVGRGSARSSCVLMYRGPLSAAGRERLAVLRESVDGFEISRRDLELRGPGEVLGTRQTGVMAFRIADLVRDQELLPLIEQAGSYICTHSPRCMVPIIRRWLGGGEVYADV